MNKFNSILLVDDDNINNKVNVNLLNYLNYSDNIHICHNGLEALSYLRMLDLEKTPLPDLILLDINMRVMNGYEFLREYKTLSFIPKGTVQLVVLSNLNSERDLITVESLGLKFIEKPLSKEKLLTSVMHTLKEGNTRQPYP